MMHRCEKIFVLLSLCAACLGHTVQAADATAGPVANDLLVSFDGWLQPRLSNGSMPAAESGIPATEPGKMAAALRDEKNNLTYHGLHFAIAVLDADGKHLAMRPFSQGFRTGERFKLRVLSTFSGSVQVENINPKWERKPIYPADAGQGARLEAGKETLVPAGPDEYFQFSGAQGEEQLVVTARDARATETTVSHAKAYRQDRPYGTNFIQQAAFDTYPVISGTVKMMHSGK